MRYAYFTLHQQGQPSWNNRYKKQTYTRLVGSRRVMQWLPPSFQIGVECAMMEVSETIKRKEDRYIDPHLLLTSTLYAGPPMEIIHKPETGMEIYGRLLSWGISRHEVRALLGPSFEAINVVHEISEYLPEAEDLIQMKDYYANYKNTGISFTAIYEKNDIFSEFELHEGDRILVGDITIDFSAPVADLVDELEDKGYELTRLEGSEENILINTLFTSFTSSRYLGGDSELISYIYCSSDIGHLLEHE